MYCIACNIHACAYHQNHLVLMHLIVHMYEQKEKNHSINIYYLISSQAFAKFTEGLLKELDFFSLRPILCNMVFFAKSEDSATRSNAITALTAIAHQVRSVAGDSGKTEQGSEVFDAVVMKIVMPSMREAMNNEM